MCRNIKTLFNFDPPATEEEIRAASLQFVRKLSGFNTPSKANEAVFHQAVEEVSVIARNLLKSLVTGSEPRNREVEIVRARARNVRRFGIRPENNMVKPAEKATGTKTERADVENDLPAGLAKPAQRALAAAGLTRLEQFTKLSEAEILQLHGMGPKALELIRSALADKGQSFAEGS